MPVSAASSSSRPVDGAQKASTALATLGRKPSPLLRTSTAPASSRPAAVARREPSNNNNNASPHPYGTDGSGAHGPLHTSSAAASRISSRDSWDASRESLASQPYDGTATTSTNAAAVPRPAPSTVAVSESPSAAAVREPVHARASAANTTAAWATARPDDLGVITATTRNEGSLFRQVYNEKLRSSVQSIIHSLTVELPADHVFAQLLADPTTQTYCKVRLAEVVETFLYATQAQQFHNLVAELARQHEELLLTQQELDRLREIVASGSAGPHEGLEARPSSSSHAAAAVREDYHTPHRGEPGLNNAVPAGASPSAAAGASSSGSASVNPMSEDAARQALLNLLEEATRDHELERSRQSLAGPDRLVQVAAESWSKSSGAAAPASSSVEVVGERVEYLSSVMSELYRSVSGLLSYVDGSLEGLDALRNDLERHQSAATPTAAAAGDDGAREHGLMSTPMSLLDRSDMTSTTITTTTTTAMRQAPRGALTGGGRRGPVADERRHVRALLDQLRDAQVHSARALDRLAQDAEQHARAEAHATRALEVAQRELKVATTAAEGAQQLQGSLERLRAEYQRAGAAEREDAHAQIELLHAKLTEALTDARALASETQRADALAQALSELRHAHDRAVVRAESAETALAAHLVEDDEQARVRRGLEKENATLRRDLGNCEGELMCAQVELHMTQLECGYWQSTIEKHEVMARHGYDRLAHEYAALAQVQSETVRHQQVQKQLTETAALQQVATRQQAQSELVNLLRTMWADEEDAVELPSAREGGGDVSRDGEQRTTPRRHREPGTLQGLATALSYAYASCQRHSRVQSARLGELEDELAEKTRRLQSLDATHADLQAAVASTRAESEALKREFDLLSTNNPMKALLARQEALLTSVSDERATMRDRWGTLNADYIALERRNAELHARCVGKEHENAKLTGLIKSLNTSPAKLSPSSWRPTPEPTAWPQSAPSQPAGRPLDQTSTTTTAAPTSASVTASPRVNAITTPPSLPRPRIPTATARVASVETSGTARSTERSTTATPASTATRATGARLLGSPAAAATQPTHNVARALLTPEKK